LATNASPIGIAVLRDVPSRDPDIIKAGAAGYAKAAHDLHRTEIQADGDPLFTTTDCDTLHFSQTGPVLRASEPAIPAIVDIPTVSKPLFY
jgi:hypothetical protein